MPTDRIQGTVQGDARDPAAPVPAVDKEASDAPESATLGR
jgi:hypothetical protein